MALRSFVDSEGRSGLKFFESIFTHFGYAVQDSLVIPGLCVNARWYEPPEEKLVLMVVFVSEMRIKELPEVAQEVLFRGLAFMVMAPKVPSNVTETSHDDANTCEVLGHVDGFYEPSRAEGALANGSAAVAELLETPPWCPTAEEQFLGRTMGFGDSMMDAERRGRQTLHQLAKEPHLTNAVEYAAWTLTHGHRINHVTILLNTLGIAGVNTLADLNALLQSEGLVFNAAGGSDGLTQGSVEVSLEQHGALHSSYIRCLKPSSDWLTFDPSFGTSMASHGHPIKNLYGLTKMDNLRHNSVGETIVFGMKGHAIGHANHFHAKHSEHIGVHNLFNARRFSADTAQTIPGRALRSQLLG
ncbi:unnamed protein product [Durusdinium trenchii]|uniref:Uncharacterized protein n=1 Tax=Durusdinium trenchii TaxID=1381693 RepID=A0ABP0N451_9DINO